MKHATENNKATMESIKEKIKQLQEKIEKLADVAEKHEKEMMDIDKGETE
jgi:prefoldin subunit 5